MLPILPMLPIIPTLPMLPIMPKIYNIMLCNVPKRCKKDAATVRADGTDVDCCSFPPELVMIAHTHVQLKNKKK